MARTVLGIAGSLRRGSYNRLLIAAAAECAPSGMAVLPCNELGSIPLFDEDLESATDGGPEPVRRLRRRVASADGLLIATPEYNWSIPGVLKNAIDWLSRPASDEILVGNPAAVIGITTGKWGSRLAQAALRQVLTATEVALLPHPAMFLANAEHLFDREGRLVDQGSRDQLAVLLAAFAAWIERVSVGRNDATRPPAPGDVTERLAPWAPPTEGPAPDA